mmetsp:Transcript_142062/g.247529  ORF Transcript_142062/g.247529 Transcript_142062/m.247529 type:complete len:507 (-) Transcript_142062:101-1621(-)
MVMMMQVMGHSAPEMIPGNRNTMPAMRYQPQQVFAAADSGFVNMAPQMPRPAPGNWNDNMHVGEFSPTSKGPQFHTGEQQSVSYPVLVYPVPQSFENGMRMPGVPEQAVAMRCDASDSASCQGHRPMAFFSMETLPTMAAQSMDSLPTMSGFSLESLPTMPVMSMDSLPEMPVQKTGTSRAYAVNSVESLPDFPSQKPGARRRKRGGRKNLVESESPQALGGEVQDEPSQNIFTKQAADRQGGKASNRKAEAAPQQEESKPAEEPDVDPVILELEGHSQSTKRHTLDWVISSVWPLALTRRGSRILQKALDVGTPSDQLQILFRIEGHVQEAMRSPHANYVLQKCIEVMAPERVQFILDELKGDAVMAARHRFGCRILQRLIEHCPLEQTEDLSLEVLSDVASLCRHQFGNFVVQHILQHGSPAHKQCIADVIHGDVIRLAKHRIASHVVSCAMVHCAPEDVQRLTQVVLADAGQLADLSRREYGSFVVREVNRARRLHRESQASA